MFFFRLPIGNDCDGLSCIKENHSITDLDVLSTRILHIDHFNFLYNETDQKYMQLTNKHEKYFVEKELIIGG